MVSEVSGNNNLVSNLQVLIADEIVLHNTDACGIDGNSVNASLLDNLGVSGDNSSAYFT